ncbi:CLUMA_CG019959, isoform A [Clunio marinus]|uniref:CLUMA_CG019959, isoform A n=1 Tax=Clunio marinus TaxID=568069 RepID=A0A1J1J3J4_9DIPT|nr:CLUMA_CG019959, isoform A [Clunio marinus]
MISIHRKWLIDNIGILGHNKKYPTFPMHSGNMPSYSPPTRSFFTPPLPREYNNPFADKPTLRGTNSEVGIMDTGNPMSRRPIPPPSITPGHERVPLRPDLSENRPVSISTSQTLNTDLQQSNQPKKVLNTPSHKVNKVDLGHPYDTSNGNRALLNSENPSDVSKIIPSISRILSGSNGRQEDIPDVLLRTKEGETIYSTENIQNLANVNHDRTLFTSTIQPVQNPINQNPIYDINTNSKFNAEQSEVQTWTIAWNIHVYLSAILFTILAVYSIFKMMFYDKLTHLFNQSYFICIHLFLIIICLARIFYLCYDAYNIHLSFDPFVSEVLLNLPATFLTVAFATLILFLLIRSLNHKNNRYSPLMRPLTVLVACSVHVGLCITLHYVESIASKNFSYTLSQQAANGFASSNKYYNNIIRGHSGPPRLLSLICQIIYIFVCLSLGIFYLYIYRILKRVLRNKSQNYIHGYQNLSYAIHITIAIALLFVSLAALQIYGAISVSSTKSLTTYSIDINWPQWGYQFSLRLIEVTIIALLSWVTGLKTGASDMQLNAINMDNGIVPPHGARGGLDFQLVNPNGFSRTYETNSFRSIGGVGIHSNPTDTIKHYPLNHHHPQPPPPHLINHQPQINGENERDYFSNDNNSTIVPDHYENPNFELRCDNVNGLTTNGVTNGSSSESNNQNNLDDYYSEPLNAQSHHHHHPPTTTHHSHYDARSQGGPYDFQNFERPTFDRSSSRNEFRVSKNLKALKSGSGVNSNTLNYNYGDNTSNHSSAYGFTTAAAGGNNNNINNSSNNSNFNNNSFERRSGVRKSGTLNNIGAIHHSRGGGGNERNNGMGINGAGGCNSSSSSSSGIVVGHHRSSGIQTLNSRSAQHLQQQQQQMLHQPQYERDFQRNTSGRTSNKTKLIASNVQQHSPTAQQMTPQQIHHQPQRSGSSNVMDQYQSSSGDSATSGSMLVAEHGFVRFRELSDIGINEC